MPAIATRTYNPLPFQDLEPRRFEDLVRQLAYDFRDWRNLEATGRSGSDDGFDIRGLEQVAIETGSVAADVDEDPDSALVVERLWLIQCKREKSVTPAKMAAHLDQMKIAGLLVYGVIFAAACNFSLKTRDVLRDWCRSNGVAEVHAWGKGELEDMLYQPKNDNLLFAYFGISLGMRRRSLVTDLRRDIATKKKLGRILAQGPTGILMRDPDSSGYPAMEEGVAPSHWRVFHPQGLRFDGLRLKIKWRFALIDRTTGEWDVADNVPVAYRQPPNPWKVAVASEEEACNEASVFWMAQPEDDKAWLEYSGCVPLRAIIAIDDEGDEIFQGPHIYVSFHPTRGPFAGAMDYEIRSVLDHWEGFSPGRRVSRFPEWMRDADEDGDGG